MQSTNYCFSSRAIVVVLGLRAAGLHYFTDGATEQKRSNLLAVV